MTATNADILPSTSEIALWNDHLVPSIKTADWLTNPLVDSGILPRDFRGTRIAPVVVGLGFPNGRKRSSNQAGFLKSSVDLDYLVRPPESHFNPHADLKEKVRSFLEFRATGSKKPTISMFPGYIFPDVAGGSLYLDNTLSESDCTVETLSPATEVLGGAYNVGNICVGTSVVVSNEYGYVPSVSLPSTIRQALALSKTGKVDISPGRFQWAAGEVAKYQQQIDQ